MPRQKCACRRGARAVCSSGVYLRVCAAVCVARVSPLKILFHSQHCICINNRRTTHPHHNTCAAATCVCANAVASTSNGAVCRHHTQVGYGWEPRPAERTSVWLRAVGDTIRLDGSDGHRPKNTGIMNRTNGVWRMAWRSVRVRGVLCAGSGGAGR